MYYLDAVDTFDEIMRQVNTDKTHNAKVLLSDGFTLGDAAKRNFKEIAGIMTKGLQEIRKRRGAHKRGASLQHDSDEEDCRTGTYSANHGQMGDAQQQMASYYSPERPPGMFF